jgi:hypothetical protein
MRRARAATLVVIAGATAGAVVADAQPNPSAAQKQQAGELVKKAIAKSRDGEHSAAVEMYQQAFLIVPQPLLLSNIASEYQLLGKNAEAVKYFCRYLEADPNGSMVGYATTQTKQLQAQLGNQIDDKDVCHPIAKPAPAASPTEHDGDPDNAKPSKRDADPDRKPTPQIDQHDDARDDADGSPGKALEYTGFGFAGAGAIAIGVGVFYGLKGKSLSDQLSSHDPTQPWPTTIDGIAIKDVDAMGHQYNTRQVEFMIGGGVALAAGTVMIYLGHAKGKERDRVSVTPVWSGGVYGVALGAGF